MCSTLISAVTERGVNRSAPIMAFGKTVILKAAGKNGSSVRPRVIGRSVRGGYRAPQDRSTSAVRGPPNIQGASYGYDKLWDKR
jgi:hypothetical protein